MLVLYRYIKIAYSKQTSTLYYNPILPNNFKGRLTYFSIFNNYFNNFSISETSGLDDS